MGDDRLLPNLGLLVLVAPLLVAAHRSFPLTMLLCVPIALHVLVPILGGARAAGEAGHLR